jgi:hypothetical protein
MIFKQNEAQVRLFCKCSSWLLESTAPQNHVSSELSSNPECQVDMVSHVFGMLSFSMFLDIEL